MPPYRNGCRWCSTWSVDLDWECRRECRACAFCACSLHETISYCLMCRFSNGKSNLFMHNHDDSLCLIPNYVFYWNDSGSIQHYATENTSHTHTHHFMAEIIRWNRMPLWQILSPIKRMVPKWVSQPHKKHMIYDLSIKLNQHKQC